MATPIYMLASPLVLGNVKTYHYSNDDCIIHPIDGMSEVISEINPLKQHRNSFDYVHELEVMRDSLGRILQQQKIEMNHTLTTNKSEVSPETESIATSESVDTTISRPQVSSRVLHLLKELETCLDKTQEPEKQSKLKYLSTIFSQVPETPNNVPVSYLSYGSALAPLSTDNTQVTIEKATPLALLSSWAYRYNSSFFTRHNWKQRFYVLTHTRLLRFKNCSPSTSCESVLSITSDTKAEIADQFCHKQNVLQIITPSYKEKSPQIWHLYMESDKELQTWLDTIRSNASNFGYQNQPTDNRELDTSSTLESKPNNGAELLHYIPTKSAPSHSRFRSKSYSRRTLPPQPPVPQYSPPAPPYDQRKQHESRARSHSTCSALQRKYLSWEP